MAEGISWRRRWGRRGRAVWRVTKWAVAVVVVVAIVAIVWINVRGEAARRDVLAAMEAKGLATDLPLEEEGGESAGETDGDGTRFVMAALALSKLSEAEAEGIPIISSTSSPPRGAAVPEAMAERLATFVEGQAAFRQMLERVRGHDYFDYDLRLWEPHASFTILGEWRQCARLVDVLALYEQAMNRPDEAMALYEQLMHLSRSFEEEGWLLISLVRISVSTLVNHGVEGALSRTVPSDDALARLQTALMQDVAAIDFSRAAELELALLAKKLRELDVYMAEQVYRARRLNAMIEQTGQGDAGPFLIFPLSWSAPAVALPTKREWQWESAEDRGLLSLSSRIRVAEIGYFLCPGYWKLWQADRLRQCLDLLEQVEEAKDDSRRLLLLANEDRKDEADAAAALRTALQTMMRWRASMEVTMAGLEVERFRMAHGRWPSDLTELERDIPDDLYAEAPMRYRQLSDGVVVYSVGTNEVDDGGEQEGIIVRDGDIAFRLYDPAVRGTLPMPEPEPERERLGWFEGDE